MLPRGAMLLIFIFTSGSKEVIIDNYYFYLFIYLSFGEYIKEGLRNGGGNLWDNTVLSSLGTVWEALFYRQFKSMKISHFLLPTSYPLTLSCRIRTRMEPKTANAMFVSVSLRLTSLTI